MTSFDIFHPSPIAQTIAQSLSDIPSHWSLTPLAEKRPRRKEWQSEEFIPHAIIADLLLNGDEAISARTGKSYRWYPSGFGLRLGEASNGLLAIDVDGASAQPILEAMSGGNLPTTVSWTSGKPGRYQMLFQIPDDIRASLQNFTRYVVTQWLGLETAKDESGKPSELLEFRYNRCQSVLPPSRHPDTGSYRWINSPANTDVALAPDWLCKLLLGFASEEQRHIAETSERIQRVKTRQRERELRPISSNNGTLSDTLDLSLSRLNPEDVFNWSDHNWRVQGRYEWAGCCPRHDSKSGTAFKINTNTLEWYCFGCDVGGHAAQYRHFVNGGNGTPKGKDFAEIVKQLANEAGVSLQKANPHEYIPVSSSGTKFRIKRTADDLEKFLASFPALAEKDGQDWLKLRRFTPDETIDSQYFYYNPPGAGEGLGGNSGLGTGKSYYINNDYIGEDDGAIFLGNRNTTIEQFVENAKERHNLTWYLIQQDLREGGRDDLRLIQDPQSKIISCIDSILYIHPQDAVGKKIVFDEVESTLKHLNYSTTAVSYRRQLCKQRLMEITRDADSILLCDGNLKDITVRYMEKLSGKKIKKVKNLYKGNRGKVTYYIGSEKFKKDEETNKWESVERRLNDHSLLLATMMEDPDPFIVGADSQGDLEAWDRQLTAKGRKTFRLDGTTSNTPEGKKFIRNPARYIYEKGIDVVLYSPSADQGLSIDMKVELEKTIVYLSGYFKRGYFFFFGVVLTDTQIQFLGRLRDGGCHLHVFCNVKHKDANSINKGLLSDGLQELFVEYVKDCASLSLSEVDEESRSQRLVELAHRLAEKSNDNHYQYECQLLAMTYFEQNNLRNCLEYAMREAGWQVEVVTGNKVSINELKETKELIRTERSEKILAAAQLTATEAQNIERSGIKNEEDKPKLARHKLLERLPGIENKFITEKKIVRVPASEVATEKTVQNQAPSEAESTNEQGLEGVHISPSESITHTGQCGQAEEKSEEPAQPSPEGGELKEDDFIEVEQEVTRPVFDADFIKRVKFQDRGLISRLEGQVLLRNPDIAKLAQQKKWHKKLSLFLDETQVDGIKRINLTTYRSPWLKIHTLLEMGFGYFIQPESKWNQETPELIAFWEKGKDPKIARHIGMEVRDSDPCKYLGRVMDSYGLKREADGKIKLPNGQRVRQYRIKPLDPICQAIYDCVEAKVLASMGEEQTVFNWADIIEKIPSTEAESTTAKGLEGVHIAPSESIHHTGGCGQEKPLTLVEQLIITISLCESPEQLATLTQGYTQEVIEAAIDAQDDQPLRNKLRQWNASVAVVAVQAVEPKPVQIKVGDRLRLGKDLLKTTKGKVVQVLELFGDWFETSWGAVSLTEVESGTWELMP